MPKAADRQEEVAVCTWATTCERYNGHLVLERSLAPDHLQRCSEAFLADTQHPWCARQRCRKRLRSFS